MLDTKIEREHGVGVLYHGADLAAPRQMNRILIGDVGSGKTAVAFWAMLRAAESGAQAIMMAPTELLAEQHYRTFTALCGALGVQAALLLGKTPPAERARTLRLLASGTIALVFGTHALVHRCHRHKALQRFYARSPHRAGRVESIADLRCLAMLWGKR